jgi:thiamine pyrophosphokinase
MAESKKYIIFLNNRYSARDNSFYRKRLTGRKGIAADGGIRFFLKNKIIPDILVGDFDSSPRLSKKYLSQMEVVEFPRRKDKTDSQLALELALSRGATDIEICGAFSLGEIDHTLGNIFLLKLAKTITRKGKPAVPVRLVSPGTTVYFLKNETATIEGRPGDYLSILPLKEGTRVSFSGLSFPSPPKGLHIGDSLSLRNQFISSRCRVTIRGEALVMAVAKRVKSGRK